MDKDLSVRLNTYNKVKEKIKENRIAGLPQYDGLSSSDIGTYNSVGMWGLDWEAYDEDAYDAYTK